MRPNDRSRRECGFTLIELLIAIAVLAVVAALAYRGLEQVLRARTVLLRSLDIERGQVQLFTQLETDLREAAGDDLLGQSSVAISSDELHVLRHLDIPGQQPHLVVVRYRFVDEAVARYVSGPLVGMVALRAAMNGDSAIPFTQDISFGPVSGFGLRVFVNGQGWQDDMTAALQGVASAMSQKRSPSFAQIPVPRTIVGVDVRMVPRGSPRAVERILMVGQ